MAERRAAKGRRMGSSRRRQLREGSGEAPAAAPGPSEELPGASELVQRVQDFFRERDKDQPGFVTRSDMQKLQEEDIPCSKEELELVFDGLDAAGTGRLSTEEFTAGLRQFLSSQKAARDHRRRKTASRRVRLVLPSPALEGVDSEEQRQFAAFMDQLGTDNVSEEQEIWQLWVKLRQDEPQLLGNLEDFLAKMRHRIQEAKSKKEALEVTLNMRVAEHDKEVQQLCEALEQQIQQEQQRLEQESMARSHQHSMELQQALDASEREVQRLVTAQMELEMRCRSLRSTQQATSTENQQLEESNQVLEDRLQHLHQQLQQTHGRLRTARAAVAREHAEEPGDRAVAELPGEMPLSPQMSPEKSEKRSEMQIRLGSQSTEPKRKSTHHVVWEVLPTEISVLGAPLRASSMEEDPFPEFLKEERFSDQSSLLREMNDAIAALSKQLKPQALGAPSVLADAAHHPRDDAEPQTGPEAATAHGTTPRVLQETLPGHVGHELFEGDLKEGPATAQLHAPDMTQAGASMGAGHHRAQELGAEQGESPEEAWRMLFLQGKGTGVKELMLKAAEHPQGALGESMEAREQALMEVEGEGWMQEKTDWEKAQLLGEAEEAALNQGENLEAGLGPPEAGEADPAAGRQLGPAAAPEERARPPGTGLREEADPPSGLSEKLEIKPGERLEPEPPSWGEARMGAARRDGVLPEVTVAPDLGMLEEERVGAEAQPWGETLDADVPPAPAQHGGSSRAGAEEGEVEVTQPREAEPWPQGESARGDAAWGGSTGAEVLLPPTDTQEGGVGTDVQPLEPQSSDANVQLLVEVEELKASMEAARQPLSEAGSPGTEQGWSLAPGVQPLKEDDKPELGLGEEMGAAAVHGEGPSPAGTPAGSPVLGGLFPVKAQALGLVGAEESQADRQLLGDPSPEAPQGEEDHAAMQLGDEAADGGRARGEHELPREPVMDLHGAGFGQGEGAGAEEQPGAEADEHSAGRGDPAPPPMVLFGEQRPGAEVDGEVQNQEEWGELELVQGEGISEDGLFPVKARALELAQSTQLWGGASPEIPQGGEGGAAVQLVEEAEDGAQGQGERGLSHEPVLDPQGAGVGQGEEAGAGVQPWQEAVTLGMLEDQGTDANMQLLAEVNELKLTPGGSTEADGQPLSEASSLDTEQGWSVALDVQPLEQVDKPELVEMEAEDAQADMQLHGVASAETPWGGEGGAAVQLRDEAEEGAQGQGEHGLSQEPALDPQGAGVGQGEEAGAGVQPWQEAVILGTLEDQGTDANGQLLAEAEELKSTPGGSTEADGQPLSKASSLDTEQGWSVALDVQPLEQVDKPEVVEMEAEDAQADMQLWGGASAETQQGWGDRAAVQLVEEAEDGAQGQGERGLSQEPALDPQGAGVGQGEEAGAGVQPWQEAVTLGTLEDQGTDANGQLLAETDKLKSTPGGSTEADLQLLSEASSLDTEQGWSMAPDVQPLEQVDKPELVEMEAEDAQADMQLHGVASAETPWGGEGGAAVQLRDEAEDGAQGQGERGLSQEPALDPQGAGVGQGEEAGAGVQPWQEAVILGTLEDQGTDANGQLLAEAEELKSTPGGSTEADGQPLSKASSLDTEQGWSVAPDVQPLDQVDKPELVEMEAEDAQADMQLHGVASAETQQGWGDRAAVQLVEEAEDGAQGQGERGLSQEPVLHPQGVAIGQGEGAPEGVQPPEEAVILGTLEDQSMDANVQLLAEELKLTPGGSTEADLQLLSEASSLDTEQGWSVALDVQPLDHVDKPELVEMEAEDAQADMQLWGGASAETPWGGEGGAAVQLVEEAEDGAQGQGERGLSQEPALDPQGAGVGQGEEAGAGVQPWQEAVTLGTLEDQGTDANVQLLAEAEELKSTPGGSREADLQLLSEASSLDTEQGWSVAPDVQPLDQVDKPELVEMEAEDAQTDMQLWGGASAETQQGWGDRAAVQLVEEAEEGAQGQGERRLPHEPMLDPQGVAIGQGEGAPEGVQPPEEAVILGTLEDQSMDANVQLLAEAEELKSTSGGSTEADPAALGAAGVREGEQSQTPGLEAGLCAAHTADMWEGAAGAHVYPPAEAALHPECATAVEGPGLEAMLGALTGPDGQVLEDTQTLEIPQGERADAEETPLDGAQGLEVVQGERLEAGARISVETQSLGIKQGHDDAASALAPPVSEVTLQISTLKLEMLMREDVLVPDVQRLGASGQAAQSELREQVSAQADKMMLRTASQQPEEKPPHVMETEQVAAGPAKPPKQEMPPVSTLHTRVQQEEDVGNDQSGMVLRDGSLGDAANSSMQPQRQLSGEQSEDLSVGQQEKKQEVGRKMSQDGKPSPGKAGAMAADGAGAAPTGSPEASPDPDHLYNVLFIGDSHVGKTSFLYRLHANTFNPHLTATVGLDYWVKHLVVDNKRFALRLWDSAGQERYHSVTKQFFRKADGVVLMYDITSEYSFSNVRYWLSCIQEGAEDGVAVLLLGNKTDCAAARQVPTKEGERLAKENQLMFYECSAASGHNVSESMVNLIRLLKDREDEMKNKAEEVPKPPQKKKGCCW